MSETLVIDRPKHISMSALSRLAYDAHDEVSELKRTYGRARQYKCLDSFRELLSFLETSFLFGHAIKFSELADEEYRDFWSQVAAIYEPRVERPTGCAWAMFSGVYSTMRTCTKDPCYCKVRELEAIMRFCRGVMVGSQSQVHTAF